MGRRSVRKGKAWERECARLLTAAGIPAERCLSESRDGNVGDLLLPSSLPAVAQCRVGAAPSPWKALKDAEAACTPGDVPIALVRRNGSGSRPPEDVAVLPLESFARILARAWQAGIDLTPGG